MKEYIAFDSHKHYSLAEREEVRGGRTRQRRVEHRPGAIRACLKGCQAGAPVAVEATGNWYWIVQEIEQAGLQPRLAHPRKANLNQFLRVHPAMELWMSLPGIGPILAATSWLEHKARRSA